MALTPYVGLTYFGGNVAGSLVDDGSKFTGADRLTIDRLLYMLATGTRHHGGQAAELTPALPGATLSTDGSLPGGRTYHYVATLLDVNGIESLPSDEVTITTPSLLDAPVEPDVAVSTGGALSAGLYYYALTALRGTGAAAEESILGDQGSITVLPGEGTVTVTLPAEAPEGATSYQIWRMEASDVGWTRVAQVLVDAVPYADAGAVPANPDADRYSQAPPQDNEGTYNYAVTITLATVDADKVTSGEAAGWRLYRTETASSWPAVSLVHHVTETTSDDADAPVMTTWVDDGDDLLTGAPPLQASRLVLSAYTLDSADTLPDPTGYPQFYPLLVQGVLYALVEGVWTPIGGGGGSVLTAPNGNRYRLAVSNTGALSTVASLELGPPPPPTGLTQGTSGGTSLAVWTASVGATGYKVIDVLPDGTVTTATVEASPYTPLGTGNHLIQVMAMNTQGLSTPCASATIAGNVDTGGGGGGGGGGGDS